MSADDINRLLAEAEGSDPWPEIDRTLLTHGRVAPPVLPLPVFKTLASWIATAAAGASAPPDYVVAPLLAGAAAMIGSTRCGSPWPEWSEPSVVWAAAVGDPSANKTPGADPIMRPLRIVESEMAEDFPAVHAEWRGRLERAKLVEETWKAEVKTAMKEGHNAPPLPADATVPPEPTAPRLLIGDTTPEALGQALYANPRGVLSTRDELAGWISDFNRYNGASSRSMWLEAFGARPYRIDRVKNNAPIEIPHLSVSVYGTTQPDRLAEMLRGADDGLASRFLWFWPDPVPPMPPFERTDRDFMVRIFRRLASLRWDDHGSPVVLPVEQKGVAHLNTFRLENHKAIQAASGLLANAMGKGPGMILRLALVLEHLWWAADTQVNPPAQVSEGAILGAIALWENYFVPMAARAFGDAALPPADRNAALLARAIRSRHARQINVRDVRRNWRLPELRAANALNDAVDVLVEAGVLMAAPSREGDSPGRQSQNYHVNPKLCEA